MLTGAAGGIGSRVARALYCDKKCHLVLSDKDPVALESLRETLTRTGAGGEIEVIAVDLLQTGASSLFAEQLEDRAEDRQIDGVINNAGVIYAGKFETMALEAFDQVMRINLSAAAHLTRILLPQLIARRGFVVNVASGAGLVAPAGLTAYAASKFALVGFSEALRAELSGRVDVSTICPAFVATAIMRNGLNNDAVPVADQERNVASIDEAVHKMGLSPERVCRRIIAAAEGGDGMVPMSALTHILYTAKKIAPGIVGRLNHLVFRYLTQQGLLR